MLKKFFLSMFLIFGCTQYAGAGTSGGVVTLLMAHAHDIVIFSAGTHERKPSCSVINDEWALSLTTPTGKAMYAILLLAKAQGKTVSVQGTGVCTAWLDRETPMYIQIN